MKLVPIKKLKALFIISKNVDNLNPDLANNSTSNLKKVKSIQEILDIVTINNDKFKEDLENILKDIFTMGIYTSDNKFFTCAEHIVGNNCHILVNFKLHISDNKISYSYNKDKKDYFTHITRSIEAIDDLLITYKKETKDKIYLMPSKKCHEVVDDEYRGILNTKCHEFTSDESSYIYSDNRLISYFSEQELKNYFIDNQTKEKLLCEEQDNYIDTSYSWYETEDDILSSNKLVKYYQKEDGTIISNTDSKYFQIFNNQSFDTIDSELSKQFEDGIIGIDKLKEQMSGKTKKIVL